MCVCVSLCVCGEEGFELMQLCICRSQGYQEMSVNDGGTTELLWCMCASVFVCTCVHACVHVCVGGGHVACQF